MWPIQSKNCIQINETFFLFDWIRNNCYLLRNVGKYSIVKVKENSSFNIGCFIVVCFLVQSPSEYNILFLLTYLTWAAKLKIIKERKLFLYKYNDMRCIFKCFLFSSFFKRWIEDFVTLNKIKKCDQKWNYFSEYCGCTCMDSVSSYKWYHAIVYIKIGVRSQHHKCHHSN